MYTYTYIYIYIYINTNRDRNVNINANITGNANMNTNEEGIIQFDSIWSVLHYLLYSVRFEKRIIQNINQYIGNNDNTK